MKIAKRSAFTGETHTFDIDVTQEQIDNWKNGELIQDAMPNLEPWEREFLMTGCTPEEWDTFFASDCDG